MKFERLGNIAEIIAGQSPPSSAYNKTGEGIPFFQGKADYGIKHPVVRNWTTETTKISLPNDILISVRAPVGPVNINTVTACIGRGLSAIRVNENVSYEYVFLYLRVNENLISKLGVGSTFTAITQKDLANIKIPLPSLNQQIHIANILTKAESLIQQRKQSIGLLDEFLKSTFLEMFGDPVRNERGWDVERLDKVAKLERGRFSPRPRNDPSYFDGHYPFIQTGDISRSGNRLSKFTQTLNEKGIRVSKKFNKGTIVIAIVGATIGATAILEIDAYATDSIIGITPRIEFVNTYFLEFAMQFWKPVLLANAPEAARPNINLEILNKLGIITPSIELQNQFAHIVAKTETLKQQNQQSLQQLEQLFGSLSQQAFKGELVKEYGLREASMLMAAEDGGGYGRD